MRKYEKYEGQIFTGCCPNPFSSKPIPFYPKGILSVRWCSISDPSKSPSALECGRPCTEQGTPLFIPPNPWGSGRDAFAHSSPAYAKERLRHSRWFPGAYAMLPSGTPSRPNTAMDGFGQQVVYSLLCLFSNIIQNNVLEPFFWLNVYLFRCPCHITSSS